MKAGVSKSGSPAERLHTSWPSARSWRALAVIARVSEGWSAPARADSLIGAGIERARIGNRAILHHARANPWRMAKRVA